MINRSGLNVKRVKTWAENNPGYKATHYLCLIPEQPNEGPFSASYKAVTGLDTLPAYWQVYSTELKGYSMAVEKYPIKK